MKKSSRISKRNPKDLTEDKKKLAIDLIFIKDKQIENLKSLKNELISLETNSKNTIISQLALRFKISKIISKLEKNGLDKEKLEYFEETSMKKYEEFKTDSLSTRASKSNKKLIKNLMLEIDDKIKSWKTERKKYLIKYKLSDL